MNNSKWIETIREHIAVSSVGSSTLMHQSDKGRNERARNYLLNNLQVEYFCNLNEKEFNAFLDRHTTALSKSLLRPDDRKPNWGAARKVLNIYLRLCSMNKDLHKHFRLNRIEPYQEVPLDNPNVVKIDSCAGTDFSDSFKIKTLTAKLSQEIQDAAAKLAKKKGINRYELDIVYWKK